MSSGPHTGYPEKRVKTFQITRSMYSSTLLSSELGRFFSLNSFVRFRFPGKIQCEYINEPFIRLPLDRTGNIDG